MTTTNQTLDLYLEADEGKRLGLYMMHRDLREEFAKIEVAEAEAADEKNVPNSNQSRLGRLGKTLLAMLKVRDLPATGESSSAR